MIDLRDVTKQYGSTIVLNGVRLSVARGEVCVLLGPSGGGKSTLLRTINGLETFDSGTIEVDGIMLRGGTDPNRHQALPEIRRRVGMVFQQFHLFPHLTAIENIVEAPIHVLRQPRDVALAEAHRLLDRVGLLNKADSRPASLSGGQQQRVAIARALAMHPQAILFDEPTSALDPQMTAEVTAVIADLAHEGQTMIVVTHGMEFARATAHRVHILHGGTIIESGSPDQVFDAPQHPVTQAFVRKTEFS
ncbi:MAG: amino acid ABC transporter ATP-binding protein [Planctomycetota bacterium]|nr:MAG: amino acid ABC transporter ATP-binding protein [Planctomycetota bacterium]